VGRAEQPAINFCDPFFARVPLPIVQKFYPLGFPLEIATNSSEVIAAATESWGGFACEFEREPIRVRAIVQPNGADVAPAPVYRVQGGLLTIVSGRANFATCDLPSRSGWCLAAPQTVADRAWFRWYFLEAMVYMLLSHEDVVLVHGACVVREGRGVLLCGASGAGKSTLAFACARAGWAYLTDDAAALLQGSADREALARRHRFRFRPGIERLFPELERYETRVEPNGKPTVEVPASAFPAISTSSQCRIEAIVFLDRRSGCAAALRPVAAADAGERLMGEMPDYGGATRIRHAETVAKLVAAPAYELRYDALPEAIGLLAGLPLRDF
jgi:hypothetical protein